MEMLESQEEFVSGSQTTAAYSTMVRFVETSWRALRLTVEAPTQAPAPADDADSFREAA